MLREVATIGGLWFTQHSENSQTLSKETSGCLGWGGKLDYKRIQDFGGD